MFDDGKAYDMSFDSFMFRLGSGLDRRRKSSDTCSNNFNFASAIASRKDRKQRGRLAFMTFPFRAAAIVTFSISTD